MYRYVGSRYTYDFQSFKLTKQFKWPFFQVNNIRKSHKIVCCHCRCCTTLIVVVIWSAPRCTPIPQGGAVGKPIGYCQSVTTLIGQSNY